MATVAITGTIQTATGVAAPNVPVFLTALPETEGYAEAQGGVGVLVDQPSEVVSETDGTFSVNAIRGVQYRLDIPAIGYSVAFRAPDQASVRFDLLGLVPRMVEASNFVDADGVTNVDVTIEALPEGSVNERFNALVVERGSSQSGPWTEIDTVDLQAGKRFYELRDGSGDATSWYRSHYINTATLDESGQSDPLSGDSFSAALVMSVNEFKQVYLFGIDLTDEDGTPYPEVMYEWGIKAATKWLEHKLDMSIVAHNVVNELHDHYAQDYGAWGWITTFEYPVIRVDSLAFQYPSMAEEVAISSDWVTLVDGGAHGLLQVVPGQGSIADVLLIPGALMPLWSGASGRVPGVWKVSYRAGFEVDDIPFDLKHVIGMFASLSVMNVAGDLVGGSGLQGWSTSIPGLSQSITTTNSSTNAGFGARILEYLKEIKFMLPGLESYYGKTSKLTVA